MPIKSVVAKLVYYRKAIMLGMNTCDITSMIHTGEMYSIKCNDSFQ